MADSPEKRALVLLDDGFPSKRPRGARLSEKDAFTDGWYEELADESTHVALARQLFYHRAMAMKSAPHDQSLPPCQLCPKPIQPGTACPAPCGHESHTLCLHTWSQAVDMPIQVSTKCPTCDLELRDFLVEVNKRFSFQMPPADTPTSETQGLNIEGYGPAPAIPDLAPDNAPPEPHPTESGPKSPVQSSTPPAPQSPAQPSPPPAPQPRDPALPSSSSTAQEQAQAALLSTLKSTGPWSQIPLQQRIDEHGNITFYHAHDDSEEAQKQAEESMAAMFPKPGICDTCGKDGSTKDVDVGNRPSECGHWTCRECAFVYLFDVLSGKKDASKCKVTGSDNEEACNSDLLEHFWQYFYDDSQCLHISRKDQHKHGKIICSACNESFAPEEVEDWYYGRCMHPVCFDCMTAAYFGHPEGAPEVSCPAAQCSESIDEVLEKCRGKQGNMPFLRLLWRTDLWVGSPNKLSIDVFTDDEDDEEVFLTYSARFATSDEEIEPQPDDDAPVPSGDSATRGQDSRPNPALPSGPVPGATAAEPIQGPPAEPEQWSERKPLPDIDGLISRSEGYTEEELGKAKHALRSVWDQFGLSPAKISQWIFPQNQQEDPVVMLNAIQEAVKLFQKLDVDDFITSIYAIKGSSVVTGNTPDMAKKLSRASDRLAACLRASHGGADSIALADEVTSSGLDWALCYYHSNEQLQLLKPIRDWYALMLIAKQFEARSQHLRRTNMHEIYDDMAIREWDFEGHDGQPMPGDEKKRRRTAWQHRRKAGEALLILKGALGNAVALLLPGPPIIQENHLRKMTKCGLHILNFMLMSEEYVPSQQLRLVANCINAHWISFVTIEEMRDISADCNKILYVAVALALTCDKSLTLQEYCDRVYELPWVPMVEIVAYDTTIEMIRSLKPGNHLTGDAVGALLSLFSQRATKRNVHMHPFLCWVPGLDGEGPSFENSTGHEPDLSGSNDYEFILPVFAAGDSTEAWSGSWFAFVFKAGLRDGIVFDFQGNEEAAKGVERTLRGAIREYQAGYDEDWRYVNAANTKCLYRNAAAWGSRQQHCNDAIGLIRAVQQYLDPDADASGELEYASGFRHWLTKQLMQAIAASYRKEAPETIELGSI